MMKLLEENTKNLYYKLVANCRALIEECPNEKAGKRVIACEYCRFEYLRKELENRRFKEMKIKLDEGAFMPTRAHEDDAGLDLYSPYLYSVVPAKGSLIFDTGVHIELPKGTVGMLKSKSGLNVKYGLTSEGVIDAGYTGSICVKLYNNSDTDYEVCRGDKISQLVIMPILTPTLEVVEDLEATERGNGGFGSTGK